LFEKEGDEIIKKTQATKRIYNALAH